MLSEEKLIKGCIAGNRIAQRQLYEQYSPLLFALCLRYIPLRGEAEDVLTMGFMTIFEKIHTYRNEGSFEGWLKKVMTHTAISTIRVNSKYYFQQEDENVWNEAAIATARNVTESEIGVKDIMNQIQKLSDGYRTIFNLCVVEGYSYEEAADMLNVNVGTIRSQLAKARKILQKKLKEYR